MTIMDGWSDGDSKERRNTRGVGGRDEGKKLASSVLQNNACVATAPFLNSFTPHQTG